MDVTSRSIPDQHILIDLLNFLPDQGANNPILTIFSNCMLESTKIRGRNL